METTQRGAPCDPPTAFVPARCMRDAAGGAGPSPASPPACQPACAGEVCAQRLDGGRSAARVTQATELGRSEREAWGVGACCQLMRAPRSRTQPTAASVTPALACAAPKALHSWGKQPSIKALETGPTDLLQGGRGRARSTAVCQRRRQAAHKDHIGQYPLRPPYRVLAAPIHLKAPETLGGSRAAQGIARSCGALRTLRRRFSRQ